MKKLIYTLVILFTVSISFAGELDSILSEARTLKAKKDYTEAIKTFEKYVKLAKDENLKDVYVEIANCNFYLGKKDVAVKYIKKAITDYGFKESDFIYNQVIDAQLSDYALAQVYDELDKLQNRYLATNG
ncbi:MAG: hypothetical protein IE891_11220 [Flavobacteriaceae bacterium]|nr:hypothetical protein [Flavobacteriaceae bacterium]